MWSLENLRALTESDTCTRQRVAGQLTSGRTKVLVRLPCQLVAIKELAENPPPLEHEQVGPLSRCFPFAVAGHWQDSAATKTSEKSSLDNRDAVNVSGLHRQLDREALFRTAKAAQMTHLQRRQREVS